MDMQSSGTSPEIVKCAEFKRRRGNGGVSSMKKIAIKLFDPLLGLFVPLLSSHSPLTAAACRGHTRANERPRCDAVAARSECARAWTIWKSNWTEADALPWHNSYIHSASAYLPLTNFTAFFSANPFSSFWNIASSPQFHLCIAFPRPVGFF